MRIAMTMAAQQKKGEVEICSRLHYYKILQLTRTSSLP